jgi:hypothetical protein
MEVRPLDFRALKRTRIDVAVMTTEIYETRLMDELAPERFKARPIWPGLKSCAQFGCGGRI